MTMTSTGKPIGSNFTQPAARIWDAIPPEAQTALITNAWCSKCRHEVSISDYSGSIKSGCVVLLGTCSECGGAAYRVVETKLNVDKTLDIVMGKPKLAMDDVKLEMALLQKESNVLSRRESQLMTKADEETITKKEQKELDGSLRKAIDSVILRIYDISTRMAPQFDCRVNSLF